MSNPVVRVNVNVLVAPTPSTLQKTGAIISQGGTNLAQGSRALLTQLSDLTPLLEAPIPLASLTQAAGTATATLEGASSDITSGTYNPGTGEVTLTLNQSLGVAPGDPVEISGATGTGGFAAIDGQQIAAAGTTGDTLTFFVATGLTMTITGGTADAGLALANGSVFLTQIAGAGIAAYNGPVQATVTSSTTFTYPVPSATASPATGAPTFTPPSEAELLEAATTFFAQGSGQGAYVLELGAGTPAQGVTALQNYITANPGQFYSYLVPKSWDAVSSFLTFLGTLTSTTAKTYFFVTTTVATYTNYAALKCVLAFIEAPGVSVSEFDAAAVFWVTLNYSPSSANRVPPLNLTFLQGVTPYPQSGNSALLTTLGAANVNYVGTGASGNVSGNILIGGNTMDGNPFNYWYSVDWVQINLVVALTAAMIAGSNNPTNPLYYNQDGITALQQVAITVLAQGIAAGLVLNPIKVTTLGAAAFLAALNGGTYAGFTIINAQPFAGYVTANPSNYKTGLYDGFTAYYVPLRGFAQIVFNVTVSNFPAA